MSASDEVRFDLPVCPPVVLQHLVEVLRIRGVTGPVVFHTGRNVGMGNALRTIRGGCRTGKVSQKPYPKGSPL